MHQVTALRDGEGLLAAVDVDGDIAGRCEFRLDEKEQGDEDERYDDDGGNGSDNGVHHTDCLLFFKVKYP